MNVKKKIHIENANPKAHGNLKVCWNVVTIEKISMDFSFGANNMKFHLFITIYEWQYNVSLAWVVFAKRKIWFHGSAFYRCKHKHFMQCLNENQLISLLMIFSITTYFQIRMTCNSFHYKMFWINLFNTSNECFLCRWLWEVKDIPIFLCVSHVFKKLKKMEFKISCWDALY